MRDERIWVNLEDRKPEVNADVFYFFDVCGVFRGKYFGEDEKWQGGSMFGGSAGFLTGDVTHWMPDDGGELPQKPSV